MACFSLAALSHLICGDEGPGLGALTSGRRLACSSGLKRVRCKARPSPRLRCREPSLLVFAVLYTLLPLLYTPLAQLHFHPPCETQHTTPSQRPPARAHANRHTRLICSTPPRARQRHRNRRRPCRRVAAAGLHPAPASSRLYHCLGPAPISHRPPAIAPSHTTHSHRTWRNCRSRMARRRWLPRICPRTPSQALCPLDESTMEMDKMAVCHGSRQRRCPTTSRMASIQPERAFLSACSRPLAQPRSSDLSSP